MSHENLCNIIMTEYVDYVKVLYTSRTDIMVMFLQPISKLGLQWLLTDIYMYILIMDRNDHWTYFFCYDYDYIIGLLNTGKCSIIWHWTK